MAVRKLIFHLVCLITSIVVQMHAAPYNTERKIQGYGSAKNVLIFGKDTLVNLMFVLRLCIFYLTCIYTEMIRRLALKTVCSNTVSKNVCIKT